jgi:hypothetical protein
MITLFSSQRGFKATAKNALDKGHWNIFVEDVTHRIHEDDLRLSPPKRKL